jgi:hypothetical protein
MAPFIGLSQRGLATSEPTVSIFQFFIVKNEIINIKMAEMILQKKGGKSKAFMLVKVL